MFSKNNKPSGTQVQLRTPWQIENLASKLRDVLNTAHIKKICPVQLFENLCHKHDCFQLEIVEDDELPSNIEAMAYPNEGRIVIKNSVYTDACNGVTRARFTMAHEIGHIFMHQVMYGFARHTGHEDYREDSEWQANMFAAALLADSRHITQNMTLKDIANEFGLGEYSAKIRRDNLKKYGRGVTTTPTNR